MVGTGGGGRRGTAVWKRGQRGRGNLPLWVLYRKWDR